MASTYSGDLRLEKMANGEKSSTWGDVTNTNLELIEDAIANMATLSTTGGTYTLSTANGATDEARCMVLKVTGVLVSNSTITIPAAKKLYIVWNATTGSYTVTVKTSGGTGTTVTQSTTKILYCDGTDTFSAFSDAPTPSLALSNQLISGIKTATFYAEYDNGNSGASKTITLTNGQNQKVTLTANTTLTISFSGAGVGHYQLKLIQDGTGSRTVSWSGLSGSRWLGATSAPAINTTASSETIVNIYYDGTNATQTLSKVGAV